MISANRLFILTQSQRLLSSETVQVALDAALAETSHLPDDRDEKRGLFIQWILEELRVSEVVRSKPTVHAELAMIIEMDQGEHTHVLPYIGVSKPSCIMCSHYIRAFNEVTKQKCATIEEVLTGRLTLGGSGLVFLWLHDRDETSSGRLRRDQTAAS